LFQQQKITLFLKKGTGTYMASFSERGTHFRGLVIVLLVGFLIGFVPMWLRARQRTTERDQALQKLQTSELKDQLSAAAMNPFPAPATSHSACGFPALGAPVCLVPRVM
jgi:predicted lipid-binding transport protein (Tim44 family)